MSLDVGALVRAINLVSDQELNGKPGEVVVPLTAKGRVGVMFEGEDVPVSIKPENLKRAAAPAVAGAAGARPGFMAEEGFWQTETEAPLLDRNNKFMSAATSDDLCTRAQSWPVVCGADGVEENVAHDTEPLLRIFKADAERTFKDDGFRERMTSVLLRMGKQLGDYHQGMGYVTSFLCLTLDTDTAYRILLRLNTEMYQRGYFKGQPEAFAKKRFRKEKSSTNLHCINCKNHIP